jgi:hypothetical protein
MLATDIESYLTATGTAPSALGRKALGDPRFVFDLRSGRRPRDKTARKICAFIGATA